MSNLLKNLPRIAARILHNTHVGRARDKEKFYLVETSYGRADVEADFEKWCLEVQDAPPRYPVDEYIRKHVDKRLGPQFAQPQIDVRNPNVAKVSAECYELTGFLPTVKSVATMLASFAIDEILEAMREFVTTLEERDQKSSMRTFFAEGGGAAVILARQRRAERAKPNS